MTKAIVTAFHRYTPFGESYYRPVADCFLRQLEKFHSEFDRFYFVDSTWEIKHVPQWASICRVNPSLRYYDAYKEVLPEIQEDYVLFLDNDTVIYRENVIRGTFALLESNLYDVVSIYDTIGEKHFEELGGQSKFCLYYFATRKDYLMGFRDCDWGPQPWGETLSELTLRMLEQNARPFEVTEDKNSVYFDGTKDGESSKDLGYYHIRSGCVAPYLLATKHYGERKTYEDYLAQQPKREYLRQCGWYQWMGGDPSEIVKDAGVSEQDWQDYYQKLLIYHHLK